MPDIYVSNYKYKAEKSLTTYINGIEVTSDYIEKSNGVVDDNYTTYDIPLYRIENLQSHHQMDLKKM